MADPAKPAPKGKQAPAKKPQPQQKQGNKAPPQKQEKKQGKGAGSASSRKAAPSEVAQAQAKKETPALIFADSFDVFHRPLSLETPRTLMPVCNIPMLDYTIEFLASRGVIEIYIFCASHAKQIQDHLDQRSAWKDITIKTIVYEKANSEGDALRFLSSTHVLRDDFILINGDVIANIDIQAIIAEHKARRKKDKECMMTAVFREARAGHHTRASHDSILAAIDTDTKQVVAFDSNPQARSLQIDKAQLGKTAHATLAFHYDLLDCRIAVCAPDIVDQFRGNFDYTLVSQFIKGVVYGEILGAKIHASVVSGNQYAGRVNCFRTYRAVTEDILNRWTHPMVPDSNFTNNTAYTCSQNRIYQDQLVTLARTTSIGPGTILGAKTVVGANTTITGSSIGKNCKIGSNVNITGAFIWDNAEIGDNVTITHSIIASSVVISSGAVIPKGCIISFGVKVGTNIRLNPFTNLTLLPHKQSTHIDLGKDGLGNEWTAKQTIPGTDLVPADGEVSREEEPLSDEDGEENPVAYESGRKAFLSAVFRCCKKLCSHGSSFSEASIENGKPDLMATKLAFDVTFVELVEAVILFILETANSTNLDLAKQNFDAWRPTVRKFFKGADQTQDEKELLYKIQDFCESHTSFTNLFATVAKLLYKAQIVTQPAIEEWLCEQEEDSQESETSTTKETLELIRAYVKATDDESDSITPSDEEFSKSSKNDESATGEDESFSWDDDDI